MAAVVLTVEKKAVLKNKVYKEGRFPRFVDKMDLAVAGSNGDCAVGCILAFTNFLCISWQSATKRLAFHVTPPPSSCRY